MLNTSLTASNNEFKDLEKIIYDLVCEAGQNLIRKTLQEVDLKLKKNRDKKVFRNKGLRKSCIKTLMGEVEYERTIYETIDEYGKKKYIYLLDEHLKIETIGHMSSNLVEKVFENVSVCSFRQAAKNVTEMTGQSMSHGAAWNVVRKFGEKLEAEEEETVLKMKAGKLKGDREVKIIFEEADGIWLSMQGEERPKGKSGKKEMKLAVSYEGWKRRSGKHESYQVVNKKVVAGFMQPDSFKDLRDASLCATYNIDEIEYRILNGDGASWIRNGHGGEGEIFQLDKFHISRAILRAIEDKKEARNLIRMVRKSQIDNFFKRLEEIKFESGGECRIIEKIDELKKYLEQNLDGMVPYQKRITLPKAPEGLLYRDLGTMESNIFHVLACRMKGKKMSWSKKGANHLGKILAIRESGNLYDSLSRLLSNILPEKALETFEEVISNTEKKVQNLKKNKFYPIHSVSVPYEECSLNPGRKAIRRIFDLTGFAEMIYR